VTGSWLLCSKPDLGLQMHKESLWYFTPTDRVYGKKPQTGVLRLSSAGMSGGNERLFVCDPQEA